MYHFKEKCGKSQNKCLLKMGGAFLFINQTLIYIQPVHPKFVCFHLGETNVYRVNIFSTKHIIRSFYDQI